MKDDTTFPRNDGVTLAERYLKRLCEKTFLSLWSYAGPFKDMKSGTGVIGKEVCDILVVFENHVIIFSDKDCAFPDTGNLQKDWARWFRRAVADSAKQAWGAERWIRQFPHRLFLDSKCRTPFPFTLPDMKTAKFHLVVVAHDVARRGFEELGGSGSLMILSSLTGIQNHVQPFTFGDLDPSKTYIHVLDDTTLNILLSTLDTISDFVSYLDKKEKLLRSQIRIIHAAGEEELLVTYLKQLNDDKEHDFILPPDATMVTLGEGLWNEFRANPQRLRQVDANKRSYFWDDLIEKFSGHALNGTSFYSYPAGIASTERILRLMARENRLKRRALSEAFLDFVSSTPERVRGVRSLLSGRFIRQSL